MPYHRSLRRAFWNQREQGYQCSVLKHGFLSLPFCLLLPQPVLWHHIIHCLIYWIYWMFSFLYLLIFYHDLSLSQFYSPSHVYPQKHFDQWCFHLHVSRCLLLPRFHIANPTPPQVHWQETHLYFCVAPRLHLHTGSPGSFQALPLPFPLVSEGLPACSLYFSWHIAFSLQRLK